MNNVTTIHVELKGKKRDIHGIEERERKVLRGWTLSK